MLITVITTLALKSFIKNVKFRGPIKLIGFY